MIDSPEDIRPLNDQIETIEAVNEALAEEGEGRAAAEVHAELRKKHFGLPRPKPVTR
jgi:hypothetical protein